MFLIIDIVLAAIFALIVFFAIKKGFIKALLDFVAVILAFVLAFSLSAPVAEILYDSFVEDMIVSSVEVQTDGKNFDASKAAQEVKTALEELPETVVSLAKAAGVDFDEIIKDIDFNKVSSEDTVNKLVKKIAEPIAVKILTAVSFLLLAVIFLILLKVLAVLISKVAKLPLIGGADKILGGILGALKGVLLLGLICTLLNGFFSSGDSEFSKMVNDSVIIGLFEDFTSPFRLK